jgi:hypothetical protein
VRAIKAKRTLNLFPKTIQASFCLAIKFIYYSTCEQTPFCRPYHKKNYQTLLQLLANCQMPTNRQPRDRTSKTRERESERMRVGANIFPIKCCKSRSFSQSVENFFHIHSTYCREILWASDVFACIRNYVKPRKEKSEANKKKQVKIHNQKNYPKRCMRK